MSGVDLLVPRFDYLAVLAVGTITGLLVFGEELRQLLQRPALWLGAMSFVLFSTLVEVTALSRGWWTFTEDRLLGISFVQVPVEEYLLFFGAYIFTVAAWESFRS